MNWLKVEIVHKCADATVIVKADEIKIVYDLNSLESVNPIDISNMFTSSKATECPINNDAFKLLDENKNEYVGHVFQLDQKLVKINKYNTN